MSIVPSTKGVTQDLSSISGVLGTILQQVKDIEAHSNGAASGVAGIAGGGKISSPLGVTKTGSGSNAVGLGSFSAPASGMSGPEGMTEAKFATSNTKTGMDAFVSNPSKLAGSGGGGISPGLLKGLGYGAAGLKVAGNLMSDSLAAMPSVGAVIDRATQYYNADVAGGNQFSRSALQSMAANTGLGYTGADGQVMNYMQQIGVSASNAPDSAFQLQAREITSASRNLNMDPMAAAQAVTGLNSGAQSASLMRNFGIATSDPRTGKMLNMDQIFNQLDSRIFAGGKLKNATGDQIQDSFYRGFLGADLQGSGLSAAQQQIYVQQHLMAKVNGQNSDTSTAASQAAWSKASSAAGNANPQASAQELNNSQAQLFNSYEQPYIDGIKNATGIIVAMNKQMEKLPDGYKAMNAFFSTLTGSSVGGALVKGVNDLVGGIGSILGLLAGNKLLSALTKESGGAASKGVPGVANDVAAAARKGATKTATTVGRSAATATAEDTALATGGSALSKLLGPTVAMTAADQQLGKNNMSAGTKTTPNGNPIFFPGETNAQADAAARSQDKYTATENKGWQDFGSLLTSNVGTKESGSAWNSLVKDLSSLWNQSGGSKNVKIGGGHGGSSSTLGLGSTQGAGTKKISFIMPVNGPITDGFGPRSQPTAGASTFHRGLDIGSPYGTPIHASGDGTVNFVATNGSMGWTVGIDHGSGYVTKYGHQPTGTNIVRVGQAVKQGQQIGVIGMTGVTTGPHVHFQMEINGTPVDPKPHLGGSGIVVNIGTPTTQSQSATTSATAAPPSLSPSVSSIISVDSFMSGLGDSNASGGAGASVASYSGAASGAGAVGVTSNGATGPSLGLGSGKSSAMSMMSLPGAKSYKSGDPYVAQDSHVNVHTGEAILTEDQANEWRAQQRDGHNRGRSTPAKVTINLQIADASPEQAKAFATKVKGYLEQDTLYSNMQSR